MLLLDTTISEYGKSLRKTLYSLHQFSTQKCICISHWSMLVWMALLDKLSLKAIG